MITNVYNKKTKGSTLMEFFAATGKLKKCFFWQLEIFDVSTTGDTAHIDTIIKFLPHASTCCYETPCIIHVIITRNVTIPIFPTIVSRSRKSRRMSIKNSTKGWNENVTIFSTGKSQWSSGVEETANNIKILQICTKTNGHCTVIPMQAIVTTVK